MDSLAVVWFVLEAVFLAFYAVLDGFDLGVGTLFAFAKTEEEKRTWLGSIGPVWNGNEVWAIGAVGTLLAVFPPVYAALLSTLYVPVYLVLASLIIRAVAIEYRTSLRDGFVKSLLDVGIVGGSGFVAFALGFAGGNILHGLPFNGNLAPQGSFLALFHPLSVIGGLASLAFFCLHGASWLVVKTEGETQKRAKRFVKVLRVAFPALLLVTAVTSAFAVDSSLLHGVPGKPGFWIPAVLAVAALGLSIGFSLTEKPLFSFIANGATVAALVALGACILFPAMLPSSLPGIAALTVANSAVSHTALTVNLITATIGVPFVIAYTVFSYFLFRGKATDGHY
jgi:cytochrome d ubiquinol oxidase subunit II